MKKLLSLDLGVTTGYAVIWQNEEIYESGFFSEKFMHTDFKDWVLNYCMPSRTVAERPVIFRGKLGDQLQEIIKSLDSALPRQVDYVNPADWKQTPWKRHQLPRGMSTHERDAIRMGLWFLNDRLKGL